MEENTIASQSDVNAVKLPNLDSTTTLRARPEGDEQHLTPGRRTYMLNPYGLTQTLKLPNLHDTSFTTTQGESHTEEGSNSNEAPIKLTKQEKRSNETTPSNLKNKKTDKLSVDIDRKLSSLQKTFRKFEKNYESVKGSIHDAVRRSVSDSAKSKMTSRSVAGAADIYHKYFGANQTLAGSESIASDDTLTLHSSSRDTNFRHLDSMVMATDGGGETGESCAEDSDYELSPFVLQQPSPELLQQLQKPSQVYENDDKSPQSLGPGLSDKAFLTKLKIKDGRENRHLQKMRNRASALQQQLEIDKRKANSVNTGKPLYKPRKEHLQTTTRSRQELMGFLQANGGRTGSWNSADHAKFQRIYNTWKGVPELIFEKTSQEIKHKSSHEIMAHFKWFEEYESMMESNKNEVRKWDQGKRQERAMIYQMANEGRKTKLDDDKRRLEHLKSIRLEEKQRERNKASSWKRKESKIQPEVQLTERVDIDAARFSRQMLGLADKIQSMSHPFPTTGRKLQPPKLRHVSAKLPSTIVDLDSSSLKLLGKQGNKSAPVSKSKTARVKLPLLEVKNKKTETKTTDSKSINTGGSGDHVVPELKKSSGDSVLVQPTASMSRFKSDTFSHKLRKEGQLLKRLELRSMEGRIPDRVEDLQLQSLGNSMQTLQYKKAIPSWRKIS